MTFLPAVAGLVSPCNTKPNQSNENSPQEVIMGDWAHFGPALTATFLASLVEAVEALTIVLAVATVRGWRPAGSGAIAGVVLLTLIVLLLGPLLGRIPIHLLQFTIGILLLLF